jgi:hypothetical protein
MAMESRYSSQEPASSPYAVQNSNQNIREGVITRETSPSSTSATGSSNTTSAETVTNFDPETQKALDTIIQQLLGGGTTEQKKGNKQRQALISYVEQMLGEYTKGAAFADAQNLMSLNMQQSMEKNMPAIAKSIESAGTSASSMQGLLSQKMANDAALSAGALGAEQAKAYAGATTNFASILEALTRSDNTVVNSLVQALNTAKGGTVNRTASQTGQSSQNQSISGKTETTSMSGGGSSNSLVSVNGQGSTNSLLDRAAAVGYDGDLRGIASASSVNQSTYDYVSPYINK